METKETTEQKRIQELELEFEKELEDFVKKINKATTSVCGVTGKRTRQVVLELKEN